jgi:hypothetical protein
VAVSEATAAILGPVANAATTPGTSPQTANTQRRAPYRTAATATGQATRATGATTSRTRAAIR